MKNYWLMKSDPSEVSIDAALTDLLVLKKGNRLSTTPVDPQHWRHIVRQLG